MKYRERHRLELLLLSVVVIIVIIFIFTRNLRATPGATTTMVATTVTTSPSNPASVPTDPIVNAVLNRYIASYRNCLGRLCYDEAVVSDSGAKVDRVGLLALPGSGGGHLLRLVSTLGEHTPRIDLAHTTNVPAYGYGKNHGWSRIVRLSRNLFDHAMALTNATAAATAPHDQQELFGLQVKQLARWHCRLSHVAAHTKLLTIFVDELVARPAIELEKVLTFIGVKYDRSALLRAAPGFAESLSRDLDATASAPPLLVAAMARALEDELQHTDNLSVWPCPSFRRLDDHAGPKPQPVSAWTGRLPVPPDALAANCSAPHVTCSVGFDRHGG